ncbi:MULTISPECIES: LacI family DNA-binding transcriptional regulator [unclassified Leifsonia]|uniref:LacI family DNA-binding transcriptional regulator n=1 Tax=unclassified Leifsonia TaxID=2663824 RepID=UPI0008A799BE|nr:MULTISPECIES: LacI family DNA-binding transcriptional regulator [unclassified Leifsonia]SEI02599.1 DNA-binding transcriptional regulator, LacI/PurR family [Leifsonia sp. CL154]SFL71544.1 DNA-binding transcriptional regulator, LacI/PurR family [Leifsonia sp. CL147]
MAVTLHDVARAASVSIKTVSNVINDYPYIRDDTKARVLAAIAELGYQPNLTARGLRSGRTGAISLIIPDLKNAYFAELADAVMRHAASHDLVVMIEQSAGRREQELEVLHGPRMRMVDGILFSVLALGQEDAAHLDIPTPLVLLGERIFNGPADHVTMQNVAAARAATEHLLALGRRRILAFGAHENEVVGSAGLRLAGYREALAAAGVPYRDELVVPVGHWHRRTGAEAMDAVLAGGVTFDGVVAFNDVIALGAMRVLQENGFRIPDDVAMIGFDDIDETRYSVPSLSTVDPGREEIAETAVRLLVERIAGKKRSDPPQEIDVPFRLVVRESSVLRSAVASVPA